MLNPDQWSDLHDGRLSELVPIAEAAGNSTLSHFRQPELAVDAKSDASPVTVADRAGEVTARKRIASQFPDDEIMGEEFEPQAGSTGYRWVIDPIDGTKSFVSGVPLYSTLLALEHNDQPIGGVILIPALGECVAAACGHAAWYRPQRDATWKPANVSQRTNLSEAVFVTTQVDSFAQRDADDSFRRLQEKAWITRTWGDGYGYLLVATGRADVMIDPIVNAWDIAAIRPIIEEAGGRFTDWTGKVTSRGADAVGTNGHLHDQILTFL